MNATGEVAAANLVTFVRNLRSHGFAVTPATTGHLVEAARLVGMHRREDVREGFRSIVVKRQSRCELFDDLFDAFFRADVVFGVDGDDDRVARQDPRQRLPSIGVSGSADAGDVNDRDEFLDVVGGSETERLMDIDFADLTDEEAASVAAMLASMSWKPASVRSRRWKQASNGSVPDMRRTMRMMTGPRGDLMPLAFLEQRPRQRPLIVLADISGSMDRYAEMLLHFIHGAQYKFSTVESFVFATRLTRITRQLRRRNAADALGHVARTVPDWSSGTRIGEAIGAFNRDWSRRVGGGGPIVLIISDGWDTGDPDYLALEMRRLGRSVHRIVWLNPLAGHIGFTPQARGMASALPFVDDLLAGGTARNLVDLIQLLQSASIARRGVEAL